MLPSFLPDETKTANPAPDSVRLSALFADWENLKYSVREETGDEPDLPALIAALRMRVGRFAVARAYADWDDSDHRRTSDAMRLYQLGIDPVYVPTRLFPGSTSRIPNSVDVKMTADAMETSFLHPGIEAFVFFSGDHSLLHSLRSLRMRGAKVCVVGVKGHTSTLLERQADCLWFYHELVPRPVQSIAAPAVTPVNSVIAPRPVPDSGAEAGNIEGLLQLLVQLVKDRSASNGVPLLSFLGGQVSQKVPGFRVSDYGAFERFIEIVQVAQTRNLLQIITWNGHKAAVLPDDPLAEAAKVRLGAEPTESLAPDGTLDEQIARLVALVREKSADGSYPFVAGLGGQFMQRYPAFRATDFGLQRFNDLVELAAEQRQVRIIGRATARFVLPPDASPGEIPTNASVPEASADNSEGFADIPPLIGESAVADFA